MVLSPYPLSSLISSPTTLPFAFSTLATLASLLFLEFTGYIPAPEPVLFFLEYLAQVARLPDLHHYHV